jgi:phytoene dehydrogenase-like protein
LWSSSPTGTVQRRQIHDHEEFVRLEGPDGKTFIMYTDLDRLEAHMKELSPQDAPQIEEMIRAARRFMVMGDAMLSQLDPPGLLAGIRLGLKMLPVMGAFRKYGQLSVQDFAARFKDPFLQDALATLYDLPDFPMSAVLMTMAWMHNRDAGYPIGGSLEFSRAIERRYKQLGDLIHYSAPVEIILVEDERAVGIRLQDGREFRSDYVISLALFPLSWAFVRTGWNSNDN